MTQADQPLRLRATSAADEADRAVLVCLADGVPNADGILLALTREPGPGAQSPTMPIISKGHAKAAG